MYEEGLVIEFGTEEDREALLGSRREWVEPTDANLEALGIQIKRA